jgi:hypothetical protein
MSGQDLWLKLDLGEKVTLIALTQVENHAAGIHS